MRGPKPTPIKSILASSKEDIAFWAMTIIAILLAIALAIIAFWPI